VTLNNLQQNQQVKQLSPWQLTQQYNSSVSQGLGLPYPLQQQQQQQQQMFRFGGGGGGGGGGQLQQIPGVIRGFPGSHSLLKSVDYYYCLLYIHMCLCLLTRLPYSNDPPITRVFLVTIVTASLLSDLPPWNIFFNKHDKYCQPNEC
jgi:hypothetical protein